jgi:light-regulated signal transduction histidine kinase (bacteriophytochrome)
MTSSLHAQPLRETVPARAPVPDVRVPCPESSPELPFSTPLARHTEELERSNAALRRFATLVAQDLRAPARQIQGCCRLLGHELGGRLRPHESELLQQVEQGALQMQRLVTELLEAAGSEAPGECQALDLDRLGEAFGHEFAPTLGEQGSRLRWIATGTIAVHAPTTRRVLHHLIDNALRHAGAGTMITVLHEVRGGGPEFVVRDDGTGVEPEASCSLFQGAREAQIDAGGLGLCRQLIEARRGWIRAEPHARGSAFRFALPPLPARRLAPV